MIDYLGNPPSVLFEEDTTISDMGTKCLAIGMATILEMEFDILDENLSSLLTPQDLEEYICGVPTTNLQLLREKTIYDSYEPNSKLIQDFWKVLESFTEEERSLYLKFVSGRSRLPDARSLNFFHKIQKLNKRNPDDYMPVSTPCYFTISLPN